MSLKKSIKGVRTIFMLGGLVAPIATIESLEEDKEGLVFEIKPIFPMTVEKIEQGRINIMNALMYRE